jgi:hypothetical protein
LWLFVVSLTWFLFFLFFLSWSFTDDGDEIWFETLAITLPRSASMFCRTQRLERKPYLSKEREIQKRRKHTCLSISVKSIVFFFSFLGGFSATELFVLFEPYQIDIKKLLSVVSM